MIRKNFWLRNINIERVHKTGKKKEDTSRAIIAKFSNYNTTEMILKDARELKDTGYYRNEYFSKETVEFRKENCKQVKELRKNGKSAIPVNDKVFWREKRSSENTPEILMFQKNLNFIRSFFIEENEF